MIIMAFIINHSKKRLKLQCLIFCCQGVDNMVTAELQEQRDKLTGSLDRALLKT